MRKATLIEKAERLSDGYDYPMKQVFHAGFDACLKELKPEIDKLVDALEMCAARLKFIEDHSSKGINGEPKCGYESTQSINCATESLTKFEAFMGGK